MKVDEVPSYAPRVFTASDLTRLIQASDKFKSQRKIEGLDPLVLSSVAWEPGTWGNGHFTEFSATNPSKCFEGFVVADTVRYWGCHPLVRHTSRMIRAHILARQFNPGLENVADIFDGLDYLLNIQLTDGSFPYYKYRVAKFDPQAARSNNVGEVEFETSEALRAIADACIYFEGAGIEYKNPELRAQVQRAASWLAARYGRWSHWKQNSNIPAFASWALASAYKVNPDPAYLDAIANISKMLTTRQQKSGSAAGLWLTGSLDVVSGDSVKHDTKIWYHSIILRGLAESLDVIPEEDQHLRSEIGQALILGVNHIIRQRIRSELPGVKETPGSSSSYCIGGEAFFEMLSLLTYNANFHQEFSASDRQNLTNLLHMVAANLSCEIGNFSYLQNFNSVAYYSTYSRAIAERTRILHWTPLSQSTDRVDSHETILAVDFNTDAVSNEIVSLHVSGTGRASINLWKSNAGYFEYIGNLVMSGRNGDELAVNGQRMISGDFDADGKKNDIISFHQRRDQGYAIHRWILKNGRLEFSIPFEHPGGYPIGALNTCIATGDFDQDGFADDLAAFYTGEDHRTRLHVWRYDQRSGVFIFDNGNKGWWQAPLPLTRFVRGKIVVGDFDGDEFVDDIAAFSTADNEKVSEDQPRLWVWLSDGKCFHFSGNNGWWKHPKIGATYGRQVIDWNLISGDFDNDGIQDDIAGFVDKPGQAKMQMWIGGDGKFSSCPKHSLIPSGNAIKKVVAVSLPATQMPYAVGMAEMGHQATLLGGWKLSPRDTIFFQSGLHALAPVHCDHTAPLISSGPEKLHEETTDNNGGANSGQPLDETPGSFTIYPNPSNGIFKIQSSHLTPVHFDIVDFSGAAVFSGGLDSEGELSVNLAGHSQGFYFVRVKNANSIQTHKIQIR